MAKSLKKNLALFQSLRKEMAAKAKAAGKTDVPNLQESMVEVHVHGGTKRKAELPPRAGKGKDVKKVRATLLGVGSASGACNIPREYYLKINTKRNNYINSHLDKNPNAGDRKSVV